ncbi:polyprenyl synthetase family protein [Spongiibacter sp. KMU-158]|uniref:Polyprenyl synthetase family protein n=2 Tax=Spongiibacter pelagi TaxID=2760804 RepID=A0A927C186_9GAMM|nr:polyprenyl synthetase family protein [Spongiibacter pelagi]
MFPQSDLSAFLDACRQQLSQTLVELLGQPNSEFCDSDASVALGKLFSAAEYSLTNGGKRIRAGLVYAAAQAIGHDDALYADLDKIAAALEMIHAYSLVHDDLPAMDDDDLRRGKPTCHIAFDEPTAILVGDGLQTRAFELLTQLEHCSADNALKMIGTLAAAAGNRGMVGGQAIDLGAVNTELDLTQLQTMHQLKTGALIRASVALGALAAGANTEQLAKLDTYAQAIGLSFQVQDDIIDIESSTEELGKQQGADQALNKPTFPRLLGLDGAKDLAQQLHQQALGALEELADSAWTLRELSAFIISRRS